MNRIDESKTIQKDPRTTQNDHILGSWAAFGGSWAVLGRSWGSLGALLGGLGPSSDGLGGHLETIQQQDRKQDQKVLNVGVFFGPILEPKTSPKTTSRRPQNESKIKTKNASLFYRSWTRLGPVLRRSWAHLGGIFGYFALVLQMFREHRRFRPDDGSRRILSPT